MTNTFSVKNFDRFQHYKDRSPPWIKLYNETLDDYEFAKLPDVTKAHLIAIWLLASRYNNQIPSDAEWVGKRINATEPVNLKLLFETGFIQGDQLCSNTLASRKQNAIPETEREGEREGETERETEEVLRTSMAVAKKVSTRASRLPDDFEPDESCKTLARELSFSVARWSACLAEFRDYWKSIGGQRGMRIDWQATFRNRLRNFNMSGGKTNGKPTNADNLKIVTDAIHAEAARARRAAEEFRGEGIRAENGDSNPVALSGLRQDVS